MAYYSKAIQEEELKNKVREDWFANYDNTEIIGKVDFYVGYNGFRTFGLRLSEVLKRHL